MDTSPNQSAAPVYARCTICHRIYKDSKYLQSYCEGCLEKSEKGSDLTYEAKRAKLGSSVIQKPVIKKACSPSVQICHYSSLNKPSKIVNNNGKMGKPWSIAFGKDGVWAVTDQSNHCVCLFNSQDQLTKIFGSNGSSNGQFCDPHGIAFDANNDLYVVDSFNNRVQKFDIDGNYLLQFGTEGSGEGQLKKSAGITVHNDRVFVADQYNHRISVFQCDGQFSYTFGSDTLSSPFDVAVTDNNLVLVANYGQHCISIFTVDGNYVNNIGSFGSNRGELCYPVGLCIDLYGFILTTEYGNHRVSIFDKDGVFIHYFGVYGSCTGQFYSPLGIACSPNRSLYVCDHWNRVQIF